MSIRVLFFGATADAVGERVLEMPALVGLSTQQALDRVISEHPRLSSHKLHLSINQRFASPDDLVHDGDEIGIFTAVSGG